MPSKREVRFAIHPLHNPDRLYEVFGPLIDYLNRKVPTVRFQLEASVNYAAFEQKLKNREIEFALPNPYQTLMAVKHGYRVFGKMGDDHNFRGIIIVRKDSGIKTIAQLKGKSISYPAPTALAATMLPQDFLFRNGLDVLTETKSLYVGSQESSIMNVFLKVSDAACTWPPPWEAFLKNSPEFAKQLEVRWETKTLPNNALVVRDDVPRELWQRVAELVLELKSSMEGRQILEKMGMTEFQPANERTYDVVADFLTEFTQHLRSPEKEGR
jgi:phosphonate transport system substrate-binding protein